MICAAYDCPKCGQLVIAGPPEAIEHYGGEHVCSPRAKAEKEYRENPHLGIEHITRAGKL